MEEIEKKYDNAIVVEQQQEKLCENIVLVNVEEY